MVNPKPKSPLCPVNPANGATALLTQQELGQRLQPPSTAAEMLHPSTAGTPNLWGGTSAAMAQTQEW